MYALTSGLPPGLSRTHRYVCGNRMFSKQRIVIQLDSTMEKQRYYVYYTTTSSFSPEEKKHLHDLFGRDFFHKGKTIVVVHIKVVAPPTKLWQIIYEMLLVEVDYNIKHSPRPLALSS